MSQKDKVPDVGWLYSDKDETNSSQDNRLHVSYLDPSKRSDNCCRKFLGTCSTIISYVFAE
jgi:hypothetical protein